MQTAQFNHEDFEQPIGGQGDEKLLVKFLTRPKMDNEASEREGRPIYKDVVYVDIRAPGSHDNICRPATQRDINRFPRHYAAFKNRVELDETEGTLLAEWPMISRAQVEELAFLNIKTVEQLVDVSDANGQKIMGFGMLRHKAREWLDNVNAGVTVGNLKRELDKRDEQIEKLQAALDELKAAKPKKKVTRKKASSKKATSDEAKASDSVTEE